MKNPQLGGRPRATWPILESIGATASKLGVPEHFIKECKRNGSKAFLAGNRIDLELLVPELFETILKNKKLDRLDLNTERARLARVQKEDQEIDLELKRERICDLKEVDRLVKMEIVAPVRDGLHAMQKKYARLKESKPGVAQEILENDFPALLKKLSETA